MIFKINGFFYLKKSRLCCILYDVKGKLIPKILLFFLVHSNLIIYSQEYLFRNYSEKDGLSSLKISKIALDSKGYLWIGTENGLIRFDGVEFKTFTEEDGLGDKKIKTLLKDSRGYLWIGTERGVCCISTDDFTIIQGRTGLNGNFVFSIAEDNEGKVWIGTDKGLSYFDGEKFRYCPTKSFLKTDTIFSLAAQKEGKLWLGTNQGLGCLEKGNFIHYTTQDGLPGNNIISLLCDSQENLWIGTAKGLVCIKNGKWFTYTMKDGLSHDIVTALKEDINHNIWIGTQEGVGILSRGKITNFKTDNGLPNNFIYAISQDHEGNMWFGTHGGLSCLTSLNIKTYLKENGLPTDMIAKIIQDKKGKYWFATLEGLCCYSNGTFKNYTKKDGLIGDSINDIMEDRDGNIWIATTDGLSILSSGHFINYSSKEGLPSKYLFALVESHDGTVWIGNSLGIIRCIDRERERTFLPPPFSLEPIQVLRILEDKRGNLWFSSEDKLFKYSRNTLKQISKRDGMLGDEILNLFEDSKGKIWICTESGLNCYFNGRFTRCTPQNSTIYSTACNFITEDSLGNFWTGNSKGLACFDGKEFKIYLTQRLELSERTWRNGIKDTNGSLWFSSTNGAINFFPPPIKLNTTPPPIYITRVRAMEKDVLITGNNRFGHDQNVFRFNFVGISFGSPGVEYKYKMEGIDTHWRTTRDRSLFYPFLPPGKYALKVKAVNNDGYESKDTAEYRFEILPPFWKTPLFLVLMVLLAGSILALVLQVRIKWVKEKAELKARKTELEARNRQLVISQRMELMGTLAAGTVHDLKNLLSVIIGYSRVMSQKYQNENEDSQNIEIIKETASTAAQMAKQILSFARPKNHSLEPAEMGTVLTEILDTLKVIQPKNIRLLWELQKEPIYFYINPARFQQLVMNLCLNAFQAMPTGGQLRISLHTDPHNQIKLEISDTGITGIKPEHLDKIFDPFFTTKKPQEGSGMGLFVVKQIVDEYDGKIEVISQPGVGTTFIIRFPKTLPTDTPDTNHIPFKTN